MVSRHVVTLANSIVGVSVLAMPFCFKQCGIVLATLSLMVGAVMTRMVCYFLLKAAVMSRRRTYEMLAWNTFGPTGKFLVEISIIGFLIGTLIAFMVVIGDLGPEILSEMFSVENNSSLRTIIMTALSLFVALPLGLLRNIDSLSSVSTASVLFYLFLVVKIFSEGFGPLWSGEYLQRIHFWRSAGVLQSIPIFSMALSCQTQVFGIYDALPEPSLHKMNEIVKRAVYICTFFYFCVGFFGYIAFGHHPNFGGNILLSFSSDGTTQLIKSMFLMSVVFSVPLVVFPCRASLHSLMFRSAAAYHQVHDISTNYIPESRLKFLTVTIVGFTLVVGILIPNIELVLGLVGSTTGTVICIIFPSIMFVRVTSKNTTERLVAQFVFFIGVILMLLTTYATLYAAEQTQISERIPDRVTDDLMLLKPMLSKNDDVQLNSPISKPSENENKPPHTPQLHPVEFEHKFPEKGVDETQKKNKASPPSSSPDVKVERQQQPEFKIPSPSQDSQKQVGVGGVEQKPQIEIVEKENSNSQISQDGRKKFDEPSQDPKKADPEHVNGIPQSQISQSLKQKTSETVQAKTVGQQPNVNGDGDVPLNINPPPRWVEQQEQPKPEEGKKDFVDKDVAEEFLKRLEEHQENQKKLLKEQKQILEELKQHHAQDVREKMEKDQKELRSGTVDKLPADNVGGGGGSKNGEKNSNNNVNNNILASGSNTNDNVQRSINEQEKIIQKISENIEKENTNFKTLENMEKKLEGELINEKESNKASPNYEQLNVIKAQEIGDAKQRVPMEPKEDAHLPQAQEKAEEKEKAIEPRKSIDKERGVLVGSLNFKENPPSVLAANPKNLVKSDDSRDEKVKEPGNMIHLQKSKADADAKIKDNEGISKAGDKHHELKEVELSLPAKNIVLPSGSPAVKVNTVRVKQEKGKIDRDI